MNFVHIIGRLAKDPEQRVTASGQKVTTLTIATNTYRNGQEETIWWRATVWGDRFDKMLQHFSKGKPIIVAGELKKPETYVDKNGQTQVGSLELTVEYMKFVPFGGRNEDDQGDGSFKPAASQKSQGSSPFGFSAEDAGVESFGMAPAAGDDGEDSLPF